MSEDDQRDEDTDADPPQSTPAWITEGNLVSAAWRLALPMMAAAFLSNLLNIVDMYFVGALGKTAFAGVTVSGVLLHIIFTLGFGVSIGCTTLVAHAVGMRNRSEAELVAGQSFMMAGVLSAAVALVGMPLAGPLLRALGAEPAVVMAGKTYFQVSAGASFVMLMAFVLGSAMRGAGDAITPLKVMLVANVINIELDPILIYGMYGMPRLGVVGSAWASVIARLVACGMLAWVFFAGGHQQFHLRLRHLRPQWDTMVRILRIGIFGSGQMLIRNISAMALVVFISPFGAASVAAYGFGLRLWFTVLMPGIGFGQAAATLVGQNLGAGKPDRAARAGWLIAGTWAAVSVLLTIIVFTFAAPIIGVFNDNAEVVATGTTLLRWLSVTFAFTALSVVLGRAMSGAGDTFWPMIVVGVSMLAVRVPLACGLATRWGSVDGVWAGMAGSNVVQGLLFTGVFLWGRWKTIGQGFVDSAGGSPPPAAGLHT